MEAEVSKTIQTVLPIWVVLPGLIAIWIVTQWPRIRDLLNDVIPSQRAFYREKQRLELLKLKYEIEILRSTNNLENIENSSHDDEALAALEERQESDELPRLSSELQSEAFTLLDVGRRVSLGAFGGFLVQIYTVAIKGSSSSVLALNEVLRMHFGWDFAPLLVVVVLTLLSGVAVYSLTSREATGFRCFALGAVVVVVLLGLIPISQQDQLSISQQDQLSLIPHVSSLEFRNHG